MTPEAITPGPWLLSRYTSDAAARRADAVVERTGEHICSNLETDASNGTRSYVQMRHCGSAAYATCALSVRFAKRSSQAPSSGRCWMSSVCAHVVGRRLSSRSAENPIGSKYEFGSNRCAPASSARWPTTAPPAPRPSPPGRGDRQRAAPASRLQLLGREPRAGSTRPCCRSRSSPVAATWSIATK